MDYLMRARELLVGDGSIRIVKQSSVYETEPWPVRGAFYNGREYPEIEGGQAWFLNQVLQAETDIGPQELLDKIQRIEKEMGRTEKNHWGPREIDIDILLYGEEIIDLPHLCIPHRHLADRQFVLAPLLELDPHLKDPVSGRYYRTIFKGIKDHHKVEKYF